jgi:hypothetical protein
MFVVLLFFFHFEKSTFPFWQLNKKKYPPEKHIRKVQGVKTKERALQKIYFHFSKLTTAAAPAD